MSGSDYRTTYGALDESRVFTAIDQCAERRVVTCYRHETTLSLEVMVVSWYQRIELRRVTSVIRNVEIDLY